MDDQLPVSFYIPANAFRHEAPPRGLDEYREWVHRAHVWHFAGVGKFNWILQTHLQLAKAGFACRLVDALPDEGVIITHRVFLPETLAPNGKQLFACVLADKEEPGNRGRHPFAQLHLVQNPRDPMLLEPSELWPASFVPFWTQLDLVPRSPARGDRFEHVAFFGIDVNLAPELKTAAWHEWLRARGLSFTAVPRLKWHDYSNVDVVLGIRGFGPETYHWKPATKLFNAWRAGVPAILGRDSAFEAVRQSELDYLQVTTLEELQAALSRLAGDAELRRAMADNGRRRAHEIADDQIARAWIDVIRDDAVPRYRRWRSADAETREAFIARRAAWKR